MNPVLPIEYLILIFGLIIAAGVFLDWKSSAKAGKPVRMTVALLRFCGICVLAVAAFNPGSWRQDTEDIDSEMAIMVDRSLSMNTPDVDGKTRWSEACRLAGKAAAIAGDKGSNVRLYTFSDTLYPVSGMIPQNLKADGKSTDILQAGNMLMTRYRNSGRKLTGMLLFSDGRQVEEGRLDDFVIRARSQETPVYTLALGSAVQVKNLSIAPGRRQYVTFAGQKTKVGAIVSKKGFGPVSVAVTLFDHEGTKAAEEKINIKDDNNVTVNFEIRPQAKGYYEYTLTVLPMDGESSSADNNATIGVSVLGKRMKVLLIEGVPFWDSKFVTQLLRKQPNMEVTSIYRISGERFFKVDTDLSQVSDSALAIFPDSPEEIASYDVIIFGKGVEYFLSDERIRLLRSFVRDQGSCIIFARGKPYSGTFPALEYLEPVTWGQQIEEKFSFMPTAAGEDCGLFGDLLPAAADPVWRKLPDLQYAYRCADMKTFTQVLAEGSYGLGDGRRSTPLIVSRRFGKGMVVMVNSEGLWHWDFFPSVPEASRMYKELWTQLIQWTATYSEYLPGQEYSIKLSESSVMPNIPVRARISYRGKKPVTKQPLIKMIRNGHVLQELTAVLSGSEENRWDTILTVEEPGVYRLELAEAEWMAGDSRPCATLFVRPPVDEKDDLSSDLPFMEKLAADSGGRAITEKDMEQVIAGTGAVVETDGTGEAIWTPKWDKLWMLAGALVFFGAEWFLRRRNGLM